MNSNSPDDWQELFDSLPVDSTVDAKQSQTVKEQVLQAYDDRKESGPWKNRLSKTGHYLMTHKTPRWAATVAALLLAGWFLMSTGTKPAFAMEKLLDTILNAQNVRFVMTLHSENLPPHEATCLYSEPGKMLLEVSDTETMIIDTELLMMINLDHEAKTASVQSLEHDLSDAQIEEFQQNGFTRLRTKILEAQKNPDANIKPLGEKEIDGRQLVGFQFLDDPLNPNEPTTIWADPETHHPYLIENESTATSSLTTMAKFEFDVDLDDTVFEVPVGYRRFDNSDQQFKFKQNLLDQRLVEESLIESLSIFSKASDGQFLDELSTDATHAYISTVGIDNYLGKGDQPASVYADNATKVALGISYATSLLPTEAKPHYAGKGVSYEENSDQPIFWYWLKEGQTWRVLGADLEFRDADEAPNVDGAVPLMGQ